MKLKKILFKATLTFLILLIVIFISLATLISTQSGLRLVSNFALPYLPGLSIELLEGKVSGPITIKNLEYKNEEIQLNLNEIEMDWFPSELIFFSTLNIEYLRASKINFKQISEPKEKEKSTEPLSIKKILNQLQLPIAIKVKEIDISNIKVDTNYYKRNNTINEVDAEDINNEIDISKLFASINTDNEKINVNKIKVLSNIANLDGNISLGLANKRESSGELYWNIKPSNLKGIQGTTTLSGNTQLLTIKNTVKPPYSLSIDADIKNLTKSPSAKANIDIDKIILSNIDQTWPAHIIDGKITLEGDIDKAKIDSDINIDVFLNNSNVSLNNTSRNSNNIRQKMSIVTKGDWENNTLNIQTVAKAPSVIESLSLKGFIKPKLLNSANDDAINLNIIWTDINKNKSKDIVSDTNINNISSPSGEIKLLGNLNSYRFNLNSLIETNSEKINNGNISIKGQGNQNEIDIKTVQLTGPIGNLNGNAKLKIKPTFNAEAKFKGKNLDTGFISSEWNGNIDVDIQINTTTIKNNEQKVNATLNSIGNLRGYPFSLETKASYSQSLSVLEKLIIRSNNSEITASGKLENTLLSSKWDINSPNIEELIPNLKGEIKSEGSIASLSIDNTKISNIKPRILTQLNAKNLNIDNINISNIEADVNIDWRSDLDKNQIQTENSKANISFKDVNVNGTTIESGIVNFLGDLQNHLLSSEIKSSNGDIAFSIEGQLKEINKESKWQFSMSEAMLSPNGLSPWKLNKTAQGSINSKDQTLDNFCWSTVVVGFSPSEFCLDASNSGAQLDAKFKLAQLPIEYFGSFLPTNVSWKSTIIDGDGNISLPSSGKLVTDIHVNSSQGELIWEDKNTPTHSTGSESILSNFIKKDETKDNGKIQTYKVAIQPGFLQINTKNNQINTEFQLPLDDQNGIKGTLTIDNSIAAAKTPPADRSIDGKLKFNLNDLSALVAFTPEITEVDGNIDGDLNISGLLGEPIIDGKLLLLDGKLGLLTPNIVLEKVNLKVDANSTNGITFSAAAESGGGNLKANGDVQQTPQGIAVDSKVTGEEFLLANTTEAVVYASPDITVTINDSLTLIEGALLIPKASITPKTLPTSVVTTSDDEVIIDASNQNTKPTANQDTAIAMELILGDDVLIDGFGFKGKTSGKLKIKKEQYGQTLGNGKIYINEGEYRAFGQGLVIEQGTVIFSDGPITKPGIDIKALRRPAEDISVGVFARGEVSAPELTIFSEPSMSQSEQLSWLVLGRPLEQSSEGENNAINQLLLSLTLSRGDSFLSGLSDTFNLDTLTIKTGSGEAGAASDNNLAELVLGKYLTPELYVSYGIGLFKPINVFSLEYSINKNWKLSSETSSESSGGDIIYTIER